MKSSLDVNPVLLSIALYNFGKSLEMSNRFDEAAHVLQECFDVQKPLGIEKAKKGKTLTALMEVRKLSIFARNLVEVEPRFNRTIQSVIIDYWKSENKAP